MGNSFKADAGGTVTTVAVSVPSSLLFITGATVTTSGTIGISLQPQGPNHMFAGPTTGATGIPAFRPLHTADIPLAIPQAGGSSGMVMMMANVAGGNPPTILSQTGSWLTFDARSAAGDYTWTLGGFVGAPYVFMVIPPGNAYWFGATAGSNTSMRTTTYNNGAAAVDSNFYVFAIGVR